MPQIFPSPKALSTYHSCLLRHPATNHWKSNGHSRMNTRHVPMDDVVQPCVEDGSGV
ncbi:uncharacterized protein LACBIDRAFT_313058 [Laccaria bicolor S238N-H82]|uniref:Predicted protein n=1 Tax=Laccaria bicolor (strain S238N-H82 / ATCC MYA-4686) TaxID=486041 RepID=B0DXF8_LACBS|nr:uncharacterized protein LACBIDRAFT_313058 [Laccaria bicolor S238N-H82]EDR00614.1 predicted protein [Laccaria bicolor S238N-H82]|eukprot:XP_001888623.1 predicted protein [Laccaria bicolor S238N-H82]